MELEQRVVVSKWLRQSEHDLETASLLLGMPNPAQACFWSQQSGEKGLKAVRFLWEAASAWDSIRGGATAQVKALVAHDARFESVREDAGVLDQYYFPTRYPDALPEGAIPYEVYTVGQARDAIERAKRVLELARAAFAEASGPQA